MLLCLLLAQAMVVSHLEGSASVRGAPLAEGAALQADDVIETAADGRLEIRLDTGTLLRVGPSTRISLRGSSKAFSAQLAFGDLWAKVHKLLAGESFAVETENGVAGVRGTELRVEASGKEPPLLRVYEGVVQADGQGFSQRVSPGAELRFERGAIPRPFDAASERDHPFMRWVRARADDREEREERRLDREERKRERQRERRGQ